MSFVVGAGLTNIDLLFENMPKIPDVGEEIYTNRFQLQLGGGIPATLINLGRLGVPAKIATELGDDMFSSFAEQKFSDNNVHPLNLFRGNGIPVNITCAVILKDDRSFITYGAGEISPDDEAKEMFYSMAHGAKLCLMNPGGFVEVYKKLKAEGTTLVLDTGWDESMSFETYDELLSLADYYTPNRKEALKITGEKTEIEAARALKKYFGKVIVKVDKDGCIGIDDEEEFFVPSAKQFVHVDSTGAGDAFLSGFCYGLFRDYDFKRCIACGNALGGKSVTAVGALSAYLSENELNEIANGLL